MTRPLSQRLAYTVTRVLSRLVYVMAFRVRCRGRENYPSEGGALVCSNHQSHLDPVLIGLTYDRQLNYLARESLLSIPVFGWLIRFFNAIPIDRDGMGLSGIKESLRRLRLGESLLVFPEGTRTRDGGVASLRPGVCSLARRGRVPIVPIGFDGAFDAWPRSKMLPRLGVIHVCIGKPISPEAIASMSDEELVDELEDRIRQCHREAKKCR